MPMQLTQLLNQMTPQEQAEVSSFAAFVIARRKWLKLQLVTEEVSTAELMQLAMEAGSFDWLDDDEEDVYSLEDGEAVLWPTA